MPKRRNNEHWSGYDKKYFKQLIVEEHNSFMSEIPHSATMATSSTVAPDVAEEIDPLCENESMSNDYSEKVWEDLLSEIEKSYECDCLLNEGRSSVLPTNKKNDLAADLAGFVIRKGHPVRDTNEMLKILNRNDVKDLPKSRNKLLDTTKEKIEQRSVPGGGTYYYRGIRKALEQRKHLLLHLDHIEIDIGIDGARPFKSSRLDLWPSIGSIANSMDIRPFLLVNLPQFDAIDTRLIEDSVFNEKLRAYMRGFKTANNPENFSSLVSVLMTDELVDQFNYKGILGKYKLEGYKCIDIIKDMHKPMEPKTFDKLMRITIELAKGRYHNDLYRKRQLQLKQQISMNSRQ